MSIGSKECAILQNMKDMPDNYWGVGYDAARNPSKPDSTTEYYQEFVNKPYHFLRLKVTISAGDLTTFAAWYNGKG